jgi:hypothetical protein
MHARTRRKASGLSARADEEADTGGICHDNYTYNARAAYARTRAGARTQTDADARARARAHVQVQPS